MESQKVPSSHGLILVFGNPSLWTQITNGVNITTTKAEEVVRKIRNNQYQVPGRFAVGYTDIKKGLFMDVQKTCNAISLLIHTMGWNSVDPGSIRDFLNTRRVLPSTTFTEFRSWYDELNAFMKQSSAIVPAKRGILSSNYKVDEDFIDLAAMLRQAYEEEGLDPDDAMDLMEDVFGPGIRQVDMDEDSYESSEITEGGMNSVYVEFDDDWWTSASPSQVQNHLKAARQNIEALSRGGGADFANCGLFKQAPPKKAFSFNLSDAELSRTNMMGSAEMAAAVKTWNAAQHPLILVYAQERGCKYEFRIQPRAWDFTPSGVVFVDRELCHNASSTQPLFLYHYLSDIKTQAGVVTASFSYSFRPPPVTPTTRCHGPDGYAPISILSRVKLSQMYASVGCNKTNMISRYTAMIRPLMYDDELLTYNLMDLVLPIIFGQANSITRLVIASVDSLGVNGNTGRLFNVKGSTSKPSYGLHHHFQRGKKD